MLQFESIANRGPIRLYYRIDGDAAAADDDDYTYKVVTLKSILELKYMFFFSICVERR